MRTKRKNEVRVARRVKRQQRAAIRAFVPNRSIVVATDADLITLDKNEISHLRVGWKAYGLSCLPPEWVPRFFVVDAASALDGIEERKLEARIRDCLAELNLSRSTVIVRSSGATETIEQRGRLVSKPCSPRDVPEVIRQLSTQIPDLKHNAIHWIVQEYVDSVRKGHLSNERRVSREPRDFVAEFEIQDERPGYTVPIAVRQWRDGTEVADFDLTCASQTGITLRLKTVALWAVGLPFRVLFEWVWSGSRLWIVQADIARSAPGMNPTQLRPTQIPEIASAALQVFRDARPKDFQRYRKLRNAKTYTELGYRMPPFYVLDDSEVIDEILKGHISALLEDDLRQLTRRPLIIRTDGIDIPADKREMLPRSEDLRTPEQAQNWLLENFSTEIKRIGIADLRLSLIAHHFIPSIAAAWARSDPSSNIVRIESLWGLPEGLYWFSHDTFEADTGGRYPIRKRLRFKGRFVAPDEEGHWVHYRASAPSDWGPSVSNREWLHEIAKTTKRVAQREKHPVAVMWFVDNDHRATSHKVLPWYHSESSIGTPKAAPRRKLTTAADFKVQTTAQWKELQSLVSAGKRIERIILEPSDAELVRNREFAEELAEFAAAHKIVVELAGGILSHAYHILQRRGAQVECVDLFGTDEEDVEYNKLVRDKIPDVIRRRGESAEIVRLKGDALLTALRQKLVEESYEALDARAGDDLIGELADIQELIDAICSSLQIPPEQVRAEQEEKRRRRGGFYRGLMLRKTSTPHSLMKKSLEQVRPGLRTHPASTIPTIDQSALLPSSRPYKRPDLRIADNRPEALLTFETELSRLGTANQSALFDIPTATDEDRKFKLSIELERLHSSLWGQVRLRIEPSQMNMRLSTDLQMKLDFANAKS